MTKTKKTEPNAAPFAQLALRLPGEWVEDLDAIAAALSRPGLELKRSDSLRMALARGIEELKSEIAAAPKKKR